MVPGVTAACRCSWTVLELPGLCNPPLPPQSCSLTAAARRFVDGQGLSLDWQKGWLQGPARVQPDAEGRQRGIQEKVSRRWSWGS